MSVHEIPVMFDVQADARLAAAQLVSDLLVNAEVVGRESESAELESWSMPNDPAADRSDPGRELAYLPTYMTVSTEVGALILSGGYAAAFGALAAIAEEVIRPDGSRPFAQLVDAMRVYLNLRDKAATADQHGGEP